LAANRQDCFNRQIHMFRDFFDAQPLPTKAKDLLDSIGALCFYSLKRVFARCCSACLIRSIVSGENRYSPDSPDVDSEVLTC
jgi:hypothetical protein